VNSVVDVYTDAELQQALASAVTTRQSMKGLATCAPRRSLDEDIIAGLPPGPLNWSKGYAEGQRNNELAKRAGSCFARGLTEEATLADVEPGTH
jgi:hypothetical protein